jgi:hypothetical protein
MWISSSNAASSLQFVSSRPQTSGSIGLAKAMVYYAVSAVCQAGLAKKFSTLS